MNEIASSIKQALISLGGVGTLTEIYERCPQYSESYLRNQIQAHCHETKTHLLFPDNEDLFFSVNGLGKGKWGLKNYFVPDDITDNNQPERKLSTNYRIVRDTVLINEIKKMAEYKCQLCEIEIPLPNGSFYIEGHHIKPLGMPYNGPDIKENVLIVCPNCHTKCDYKLIELSKDIIKNNRQNVNQEFIDFHNKIYRVRIL